MTTTELSERAAMSGASSPLVVIEGNQGTGKTTVSTHISARLGATWLHYPPGFARLRHDLGLDSEVPPLPRLLYYLAATLHLGELAKEALRRGSVVCDRYAPSPVSLLVAEGAVDEATIERQWAPFEACLPRPIVTLLLVCDHSIVQQRILSRSRPLTPVEYRTAHSLKFFSRREEVLRNWAHRLGPVEEIDTGRLTSKSLREEAWRVVSAVVYAHPMEKPT